MSVTKDSHIQKLLQPTGCDTIIYKHSRQVKLLEIQGKLSQSDL